MSLYEDYKNDICNLSYWYPKIKDCGVKTPETFIMQVPENIMYHFFLEGDGLTQAQHQKIIYDWVVNELMPNIPETLRGLLFIKNGCFSNKFDFSNCAIRYNAYMITHALTEINYTSLMYDTSGNTEVIIRQRIMYDSSKVPCIYNGMPLHAEYRIFYDFDNHKPLYMVNYWDWDYCYNSIARNATDKIIYEAYYPTISAHYEANKDKVLVKMCESLKNVTELKGIWSVDVLEDECGDLWLIDMAPGFRSAYWDPQKAGVTNADKED